MELPQFVICVHCGDRIGVYERAVVINDRAGRVTSLAREPELRETGTPLMHAACALTAGIDPAPIA